MRRGGHVTFRVKVIVAWTVAATTAVAVPLTTAGLTRQVEGSTSSPSVENTSSRAVAQLPPDDSSWKTATCSVPPEWLRRSFRGYYPVRSPDLSFIPHEPHFFGQFKKVTTHSGPWDYLQTVPLVLYGPGFIREQGSISADRPVTVADLAPTFARLLGQPFPQRRPGKVLTSALVPKAERPGRPRIIVTVVWDGAGWNTLTEWPRTWPNLSRFIARGTSYEGAIVGSNPSVTPAIHANMGTGAFPKDHGIVSIPQRHRGRIEDSWGRSSPRNLEIKTLADIYDQAVNNRAKVGLIAEQDWHLGMIGHGAYTKGGDRDFGILTHRFETNEKYYAFPDYMRRVPGFDADLRTIDLDDGKRNGRWLGHKLPENRSSGFANPVWSLYQMRMVRALLRRESFGHDRVPDLFYTNFKQIDKVSHAYFLQSTEMRKTIPYSDEALGDIVRWLNNNVGERRWVLAFTADHGVGPRFQDIGAWPIDIEELKRDVAVRFRVRVSDLFQSQRPQGFWLNAGTLRRQDITRDQIANFLLDYKIRHNVRQGQWVPSQYDEMMDDLLFAAAWPSARLTSVSDCHDGLG